MSRMYSLIFSLYFCCSLTALTPAQRFTWSDYLAIPPGSQITEGNQILHFNPKNKPYWENEKALLFVKTYLSTATALESDAEVLKFGSDQVRLQGSYIELGVCTGKTINFIAALNPHQKIYGFDSFQGLPEEWIRDDFIMAAGTFAFKNQNILPPVLHNVDIFKGLFSDTLNQFIQSRPNLEPIAFLHMDSDIYSSAVCAFKALGDRIVPGTIIVFDELYNYPGVEQHEWKAFQEFLEVHNLTVEYLAYNIYHEQVAVRIASYSPYLTLSKSPFGASPLRQISVRDACSCG